MKFSIITPSFNQAEFIEQTIKSVVSQKVDLEYFIIDGGSTDGSVEIIKKYAQKYSFIKWQSKKDKGQTDAINQGLKKCTGDVVAYINSDDYYLPGSLKKVEKYFQTHQNKSWLVGDCRVSDSRLKLTFTLKHLWPIFLSPWFLKVFNTINQPSVFIKIELVQKVGEFDENLNYAFDYDYWLRCLNNVGTPGRLREILSVFRIQPNSKGNTAYKKQFAEDFRVINKYSNSPITLNLHRFGKSLTEFGYRSLKS